MLGAEEDDAGEGAAGGVAEQEVAGVAEPQRQEPAEQPLERALEQEGAADEPVGGADQAHDRDLAGPLQDGEPDGDPDDHHGHPREGEPDHQPHEAGDVPELVQSLDPVTPVAHVVHEAEAPDPLRDALHRRGVAVPLLQPHLDRGGERIGREVPVGVAELHQLGARAAERLRLRDVAHVLHLGKGRDVLGGQGDRLGGGAPEDERDDLDPLLDAAQRLAEIDRHQPEEADGEEREGDGGDGQGREQRRAPEGQQRLAGQQPHDASVSSASSTAVS